MKKPIWILALISVLVLAVAVYAADEEPPTITLKDPENNEVNFLAEENFTFQVNDPLSNVTWCRLYLNDTFERILSEVDGNATNEIENISFENNGTYSWFIQCRDASNNIGNSTNFEKV